MKAVKKGRDTGITASPFLQAIQFAEPPAGLAQGKHAGHEVMVLGLQSLIHADQRDAGVTGIGLPVRREAEQNGASTQEWLEIPTRDVTQDRTDERQFSGLAAGPFYDGSDAGHDGMTSTSMIGHQIS